MSTTQNTLWGAKTAPTTTGLQFHESPGGHHAACSYEVEYTSIQVTASIPLNVTQEAIGAVSRRVAVASPAGKLALGIVAAGVVIGAIWLVKSGKASTFFERAWPVVQELGHAYGPPLMEAVQPHTDGQVVFSRGSCPGPRPRP